MTAEDATRAWLEEAWAIRPETFGITVEGAAIACRGWNLAARGAPLILLVHGFRAHARWWDHIAPSLIDGHRVVALDLGGMGDSDRRASYSRAQSAREVLGVAAAITADPVTIVAHSFGGIVSLIAAARAPERIRRLIVIDSAIPIAEEERDIPPPAPARVFPDRETLLARFRLMPPGRWPQPDLLAYVAGHSIRETDAGWTWKFDEAAPAGFAAEDFYASMFGVGVPTDLIHGALTEIMPPERRARMRDMAPNCGRDIAIPAAHHHVLLEQPIALVAALRALLANGRPS